MIDRRPALIARCLGVADVVSCVNFARDHHLALCEGGLMLDMSLMRGVWVDPSARTARAQAGCLLGDVDRETQLHGLAAVLGFVSNTGIAGLTVGGGFGYLSRRFGWTSDNVRSMEVVTADGRVTRADERTESDLFWGLRGGGGNFGVVTSFEYQLHSVGPEIMAGAIAWPAEQAHDVLAMYRTLVEQAPPELTIVAALRMAPPVPWLPADLHGRPIVALFVCHSGSPHDGERLVAPIKSFGSPAGDVVMLRPYVSQQAILDATQPKGRRNYWKSEYLPGLEPAMLTGAVEHAGRMISPHSVVLLFPIDGALNRRAADHSAVGNHDAVVVLNVASSWERPQDDAVNIEWARAAWRDLRRFSTGGTYVNFLTEEEATSGFAPRTVPTMSASSRSRRSGTRRISSASTRTSRRPRRDPAGGLRLRDGRTGDRDAIRAATLAAYKEYASRMPVTRWQAYRRNIVETLADPAPAEQIVAEENGTIVGAVLLYPPQPLADGVPGAPTAVIAPEVRLLAVTPSARGRGVGAALMDECVRRARETGAAAITLHTSDLMEAAMRLYARMGFVRAAELDFNPAPGLTIKGFRLALGR